MFYHSVIAAKGGITRRITCIETIPLFLLAQKERQSFSLAEGREVNQSAICSRSCTFGSLKSALGNLSQAAASNVSSCSTWQQEEN
jgi:hypothetical protein